MPRRLRGMPLSLGIAIGALALVALLDPAMAAEAARTVTPIYVFGIPVDFILFGLTLLGVALFHHHTLYVALTGLAAITLYKLIFTGFKFGVGLAGFALHMQHEWVILANLFLLLMGFALLSRHFELSRVPDEMPAFLPDDWKGGLALLAVVFILSGFLDNIAAALIGGTMAKHVFRGKVHIGYLAAIVAASNAGGAGSVVGDTTTTMMWIDGISPLAVVEAYVAAAAAFVVFAIPAAIAQHRFSPIVRDAPSKLQIEWVANRNRRGDSGRRHRRQRDGKPSFPCRARCRTSAGPCGVGWSSSSRRRCGGRTGRSCRRRPRARSSSWRW